MLHKMKLNFFILLLCLTGCNLYSVDTYYDELRKTEGCSLKNNLLKVEWAPFWGTRRLELNLDRLDKNKILAQFSLLSVNRSAFFKPASHIFKIIHKDHNVEEMRMVSVNPVQNSTSTDPVFGPAGRITTYTNNTISFLSTEITREQIIKIASAERVEFSLQTTDGPIKGELDKEDLQPIREFIDVCLKEKLAQ